MALATEVRLYAIDARAVSDPQLARWSATLDGTETTRAERFVFEKHRRRFLAAHGFLREILGRELGCSPQAIEFDFGAHGKPRVRGSGPHFSLTHTGEHALVAVSDRELGLDAEEIRPARVDAPLAQRVMTDEEFQCWTKAERVEQVAAFFRLWCAKESVMKSSGRGMDLGPQGFAVLAPGSLDVGAQVTVDGKRWTVQALEGGREYSLALSTDGEARVVRASSS